MLAENFRAAVSHADRIPPKGDRDRCAKRATARTTHTLPPCARSEQDSRRTRTNMAEKRLHVRVSRQRFLRPGDNAELNRQRAAPALLPGSCFAPARLQL